MTRHTRRIGFGDAADFEESRLGGWPLLDPRNRWPQDSRRRKPLSFALQFTPSFLKEAGAPVVLKENQMISVFIASEHHCGDTLERLAIQNPGDVAPDALASYVLIHKSAKSPWRRFEECGIPIAPCRLFLGEKEDDLVAVGGDRSLLECSKVGCFPTWLQKPIEIAGSTFVLQISSRAFAMAGPRQYESLLHEGMGFLFLNDRLPTTGRCGYFFIQYS